MTKNKNSSAIQIKTLSEKVFKVGSVVRKGSCVAGLRPDLIGFKAKTTADTKLLAEIYAESVS